MAIHWSGMYLIFTEYSAFQDMAENWKLQCEWLLMQQQGIESQMKKEISLSLYAQVIDKTG